MSAVKQQGEDKGIENNGRELYAAELLGMTPVVSGGHNRELTQRAMRTSQSEANSHAGVGQLEGVDSWRAAGAGTDSDSPWHAEDIASGEQQSHTSGQGWQSAEGEREARTLVASMLQERRDEDAGASSEAWLRGTSDGLEPNQDVDRIANASDRTSQAAPRGKRSVPNSAASPPKKQAASGQRVRRRGGSPVNPTLGAVLNILLLLVGSFIIAVSFNIFLVPLGIASGGVSGISILVERLADIPPAYTQWALNVPLFLLGLWLLGRRFALKTALGSFILPLFVLLTSHWEAPTDNAMLASIYGGIGVGAGLGLVFRGRGSTGGLDLAAQLLHKFTGIRLGLAVACFDGLVIIAAGLIIKPENALYALVGLFVTSKTIDFIQSGFSMSKVAFVVSNHPDDITQVVLHDLDRGLTKLGARGGYTDAERTVLMIVVSQGEVSRLKQLVRAADPDAFVIISDTAEVVGQGFSLP
ncbi:YitT family protein [Paenibacillus aurantiacus]|uniref:YitT family protein n=1 Tax=Paenibacillus aurantiacus TaxID=1936118 RepID=A0ABV5KXB0_9BACL